MRTGGSDADLQHVKNGNGFVRQFRIFTKLQLKSPRYKPGVKQADSIG
jgi:hypothetical protein